MHSKVEDAKKNNGALESALAAAEHQAAAADRTAQDAKTVAREREASIRSLEERIGVLTTDYNRLQVIHRRD